jgi:hypothetical protein
VNTDGVPIPRIKDKGTLLHVFNTLLTQWPRFINNDLVAFPFPRSWSGSIQRWVAQSCSVFRCSTKRWRPSFKTGTGSSMHRCRTSAFRSRWRTVAVVDGEGAVRLPDLAERFRDAAVLEVLELVLHPGFQRPCEGASDRGPRLESKVICSNDGVGVQTFCRETSSGSRACRTRCPTSSAHR